MNEEDILKIIKVENLYGQCRSFMDNGEFRQVIDIVTKAIEIEPECVKAYNLRGLAYGKIGEYDKAEADLRLSLETNEDADTYFNLGQIYYWQGLLDEAEKNYNKAIELSPDSAMYYVFRGLLYFYKCDFEKAITDCCKAIDLGSKDAVKYVVRGEAYAANTDYQKGYADLRQAFQLDPDIYSPAEIYIGFGIN